MLPKTAYCVRCKRKTTVLDPQEVTLRNLKRAMRGKCAECGCGIYRILPGKKE